MTSAPTATGNLTRSELPVAAPSHLETLPLGRRPRKVSVSRLEDAALLGNPTFVCWSTEPKQQESFFQIKKNIKHCFGKLINLKRLWVLNVGQCTVKSRV